MTAISKADDPSSPAPAATGRPPVAIVTGAAQGIGRAIADLLVSAGWRVVVVDVNETALAAIVDDRMLPVQCDVSDEASVSAAVDAALEWGGSLDLVCNNAGIGSFLPADEVSVEEWNRAWAINVTSVMLFGRYAVAALAESPNGSIVNIASDAAFTGIADRAAYCATKGAVVSLSRAMAADFAGRGIRVNAVAPAAVDSSWLLQRGLSEAEILAAKAQLAQRIPLGRLATPRDIAECVRWLASPQSAFVTGTVLTVDGGANGIRVN